MTPAVRSISVALSLVALLPLVAPVALVAGFPVARVSDECCTGEQSDIDVCEAERRGCCSEEGREEQHPSDCPCPNCPNDGPCVCMHCVKCLMFPSMVAAHSEAVEPHATEAWLLMPESPRTRLLRPPQEG